MKCETVRNLISSYIDKDLNDVEKIELERHLAECEECREEYESLLDIIAVCNNLEEVELPQNFRTDLHQKLVEEKSKKKFFASMLGSRNRKMATGLVAAVLVLAVGIGSSSHLWDKTSKMSEEMDNGVGYGSTGQAAVPPAAPDMNYSMKSKSEGAQNEAAAVEQPEITSMDNSAIAKNSVGVEFSESLMADRQAPVQPIESSRSGRMVIRTGNISVNVTDVDKTAIDIKQLTESTGGYVENSQIENVTVPVVEDIDGGQIAKEDTQKYANLTIRVPEADFDNVFNNIKGMGKLVSENMSGSDITAEYRDTTARVDNLKIQEESLKQLMTKAKNVEEILKIEQELNKVRTDIDIYSGNLKRWDNLVQLSTINIYVTELKPEELKSVDVPGMWEKAYQGFIKAINNIVAGLEKAFIILVAAIPYLAVIFVLSMSGLYIARRMKKKK